MGHRPPANLTQQLGDLLFAVQHHRGARRGVLVDRVELGIVGVEGHERVVVALLYGVAHSLEVEAGSHLFSHALFNLPCVEGWSMERTPDPMCVHATNSILPSEVCVYATWHKAVQSTKKAPNFREHTLSEGG